MFADDQTTQAKCCRKKLFSVSQLSGMAVNKILLGVFERYNIFKTFKAVIIKAEAILFDDLLANARGISSLCLEHTIEAGIIWT